MLDIQDIQSAIKNLPPGDFEQLKDWFDELAAQRWDKQIETDIEAGKLDDLADKAIARHKAGKSTEL